MRADQLTLPQWNLGQVLLPEHFQVQEKAVLAQVAVRQCYGQPPAFGVAAFELDEALLAAGTFAAARLTLFFQNGLLLDVPGNATVSNLSLAAVQEDRAEIWGHVVMRGVTHLRLAAAEHGAGSQHAIAANVGPRVAREGYRLELRTGATLDGAIESIKLAEVVRGRDGGWALGTFIPPLCSASDSPFLQATMRQIVQNLELAQNRASAAIVDNTLCGEEVWAARTVLAQVCAVRSLLAEVEVGISHHPYRIFEAIRQLTLCVLTWLGEELRNRIFAYRHLELGACFAGLLDPMQAALLRTVPVARRVLHFVLQDRTYLADPLPAAVAHAAQVYLAVERKDGETVSLTHLKLAAPGRLGFLRDYALPGISLQLCPPPTDLEVGRANLDFYLLEKDGEWAQALQAGALGFFSDSLGQKLRATLCWGSKL